MDDGIIIYIPQHLEIFQFCIEPFLNELQDAIKETSSRNAPGKNGIPTKVLNDMQ